MPSYDYICDNCQYSFEEFQSMASKPLKKCPKCGKRKLKRLIGAGAGILFKGQGFYKNDYPSESYKKGKEKENPTIKKKSIAKDKK